MKASQARDKDSFILNRKTGIIHRADCRTLPRLPWLPYGTTWAGSSAIANFRPCLHCLPSRLPSDNVDVGR